MKTRGLVLVLSLVVIPLFVSASTPTLAVLDFENNSFYKPQDVQPLSKGLAQIMISELARNSSVRVVERQKLRSLMDELKLSQAGVVSEESSIQVGKMLGAKHLVFGGYMVMMDDKVRIDTRIVEVETGLTLKAGEVTGKTKDILTLIRKLGDKILSDLDIRLTDRKGPDQGKVRMDALKVYSEGLDWEDNGNVKKAVACYRQALEMEPGFSQAKARLAQLGEK
jgi:TolB-like protein